MTAALASRLLVAIVGLALTSLVPCHAQAEESPAPSAREKLIQDLFEFSDSETLAVNIEKALKAGIPQQAVLEARFLFLVDQRDDAAIARLAPVLEMQRKRFRIEDSVIFSVPEEFFAIIEYCRSLAALEKGDEADFKKHIQEAFWLSPRQADAFAPHIERLRLEASMAALTIDLQRRFARLEDGTPTSLAALTKPAGHLLVHFWSPWSNECEAFLPDFIVTAQELARHHIAVASMLVEPSTDTLTVAREFRSAITEKNVGEWIVDNSDTPFSRLLRVQDLPTVVLLNPDGKILFNGHPADDELWTVLREVAPDAKRPSLQPDQPPRRDKLPE